ncbi:MAG: hypothetical protein K8F29_09660 [Kofleriaceae bacterium]|nr:hypothetical protein [Candidatus Methylomirabilis lanthanidiphila]
MKVRIGALIASIASIASSRLASSRCVDGVVAFIASVALARRLRLFGLGRFGLRDERGER